MADMITRDGVAEFDCTECGEYVISYGHTDNEPVCAICRFLRSIIDHADRELMRMHLKGARKVGVTTKLGDDVWRNDEMTMYGEREK